MERTLHLHKTHIFFLNTQEFSKIISELEVTLINNFLLFSKRVI